VTEATERLSSALADRYRILERLGEGGMATVYLAEDLKHDRKVAVKVLRPELAAVLGAERFVQEIKTTANLQHPHILPLFDSGEADTFLYYVMPYVEGETLRGKLDRETQFGIDEAVKIATEVADALDYAHRQGVIHRDIKPENILLHDGRPTVADFGIALAVSAAAGGRMTETGLSLGTPHYMSPEQATAEKEITGRSDIYSLGSVLYEMLTGDPPHTGSSAQQIVMKIIAEDVAPVTRVRKSVPANVAAAVARSLEKLPADRFDSAQAFAAALTDPGFTFASGSGSAPAAIPTARRSLLVAGWVASLALVGLAGWLLGGRGSDDAGRRVMRLSIDLAESPMAFIGDAPLGNGRRNIAFAPDGNAVAYVGLLDGEPYLFTRRLDEFESRLLPGTEGAYAPFYSPNGRSLGYFVGNELRRIALEGGAPITLTTVANPMGGDWTEDGRMLFTGYEGTVLLTIPSDGGQVTDLGRVIAGWRPQSLDGGRRVLVSNAIHELESGRKERLVARGTDLRYIGDGILVHLSGSTLMATRVDPSTLEPVGRTIPVLTGVRAESFQAGQWDVSARGDLVYAAGEAVSAGTLTWLAPDGRVVDSVITPDRLHGTFAISPDGGRLAIEVVSPQQAVWMYDLATGAEQKLSLNTNGARPNWSPDGTKVLFRAGGLGSRQWYLRTVEAGAAEEPVSSLPGGATLDSWSPDGRYYAVIYMDTTDRVAALEVATGELIPIHESDASNWGTVFSPDGRAVAYTSDETGEYHVNVSPFPPTGLRRQVSREGGAEEPLWSPTGDRLYYRNGQRLMSVSIGWTPELQVGPPQVVFERDWVNVPGRSYDISPDGTRFLVILPESGSASQLNVILGWRDEVRRLLEQGG
jgi:serine/threonine-protein kinase